MRDTASPFAEQFSVPVVWRVQYTQPSLYQAKESADAAKKKVLWAEVRKEAATVSDVKAKVGKDKAAAVAEEDRELLEVEEAVLTTPRSSARTRRGSCPSSSSSKAASLLAAAMELLVETTTCVS